MARRVILPNLLVSVVLLSLPFICLADPPCQVGQYQDYYGNCATCSSTCKDCTISRDYCTMCPPGYYVSGGSCYTCISNCQICQDRYTCSTCKSGYTYSSSTNSCRSSSSSSSPLAAILSTISSILYCVCIGFLIYYCCCRKRQQVGQVNRPGMMGNSGMFYPGASPGAFSGNTSPMHNSQMAMGGGYPAPMYQPPPPLVAGPPMMSGPQPQPYNPWGSSGNNPITPLNAPPPMTNINGSPVPANNPQTYALPPGFAK